MTHVYLVPLEHREDVGSPGTNIMDDCEPPSGCQELLIPGSLQEQRVLLTTEPPLQHLRLFKKDLLVFLYMDCFAYMLCITCVLGAQRGQKFVYHMRTWCPERSEESVGTPDTDITGGCESPCGYWEQNPCPLVEL